jgi:hypothetical protein
VNKMPVVYAEKKIPGQKQKVCDANCYGAIHIECDCICGGVNHGVGLWQAIKNVNAGLIKTSTKESESNEENKQNNE